MNMQQAQSYHDIFQEKYNKCESKKDYKKLCQSMIKQFDAIDKVDMNQWKVFSTLIGSDLYAQGVAMAIKMYIYELNGLHLDIVSVRDIERPDS